MPTEILPNSVATKPATAPLYSLLIGTNDIYLFGTGSHEAAFNNCHQATLAWLGISRTNKVLIGDAAVTTQSGVWTSTPASNSCCISTLTNATGSGTIRFALSTTGASAYLWYSLQTTSSGSFTVSVDGASPSAPTQTLLTSAVPGLASSYGLLRFPVAAGTHTFDIAAQSGTVSILAMGSAPTLPGPTVLVGDIPSQVNGDTAAIATYTAHIQANVALLHADGLDLRFVPTQSYMLATPAEMMDQKHPNALGLSNIAAAFAAAITSALPATDTTSAATASFTTSTLPIGSHSIDILYSGDSRYAPADAGSFTETIYDGSTTTTLISDAATYAIQSPITLTATVPQPAVTGLVLFSDQSGPLGSAWLNQPNFGEAILTLPSLPPGIQTITAQFQGDFQYSASVSNAAPINVAAAFTTTALSAPATRFFAATAVPLTATVTPASASGSIAFADGGISLGTSPLVSGAATFTTATLTPGTHNLTAAFSGNATEQPSQSPVLTLQIDPSSSTVALAPLPISILYGTPLALSVTVSPATATGTVTIADGTTTLGQPGLANAVATLTATNLTPGTHTFIPTYSGDANDLPSIGSPVSTVVTRGASSVVLAPIPPSATFGTPIALTATVNPSAAAGTITFNDAGSVLAQLPTANGSATFTSTTLDPGSHTFTATYSGDTFYSIASSAAVSTTITLIPSSISLAPLPLTNSIGNQLTLTATISPTTATGTVLFRDQTQGILGQTSVANGTASLTLPSPALGSYSFTATYSGDTHDTPATSNPIVTHIVLIPTLTSLVASPSAAAFATPITLTATVTASATGLIAFFDGSSLLGSALLSNGTAILTTASLASGTHTLHADYAGSALNAGSTSGAISVTITAQPTATTLALAQNPITAAASVICNIRIAALTSNPSGTITLRSGSNILATGLVVNPSGGFAYATLSFPATTLGLGTFPLVAAYSGDPDHQPSSSSALLVTITGIPTTTTLTLASQQIPIQGSTILTAAVVATATPAGSIAFSAGGTTLATVPLSAAGTASFAYSGTSIGASPIVAAYIPTGLYAASNSSPQTVTVTPPLVAALSSAAITTVAGSTATATLTLTPLSGFSGPVSATCKSAVTFVTCSLTAPAMLTAQTTIPITVSVAQTVAALDLSSTSGFTALAVTLPILIFRKRRRTCALMACAFCAVLALNGCAEGGNFNSIPLGPQFVTITLTAAGTSIPLPLIVNISN